MSEQRVERRLAAIFAADVVGYSRLMGSDEEKTLAALKGHRRELIDPLITQHRGRIFKTTGDGILIEFASVVDAVRCAIVMQQGMEDRNANLPEAERIRSGDSNAWIDPCIRRRPSLRGIGTGGPSLAQSCLD